MPIERRDILFNLLEMTALLEKVAGRYPDMIPAHLSRSKLVEVMHTRDFAKLFHDQKTRMLALLSAAPKLDGTIFRATKPGAVTGERSFGFFVSDDIMLGLFLAECAALKIVLPRRANKLVIAEDLKVGLRFIVDDNALTLE